MDETEGEEVKNSILFLSYLERQMYRERETIVVPIDGDSIELRICVTPDPRCGERTRKRKNKTRKVQAKIKRESEVRYY